MKRTIMCAVVCLFVFGSAKADTFTLTTGGAATGFDQFSLFASGPNISISAAAGGEPGNLTFATCGPSPCAAGSILNVGGAFRASQLNIGFSGGIVILNGVTFNQVFFDGVLNFTGSVVLPDNYVPGQPFEVPFTMQGQLIGFIPCPDPVSILRCEQVFDISLNGAGIATVAGISNFFPNGPRSVGYRFSPSPETIPEPATLGLLGAGLLALLRGSRKRRARSRL